MVSYEITKVGYSNDIERVNKGYEVLKEFAKVGKYIRYGNFYSKLGLNTKNPQDRNIGADVLGDINIYTYNKCGCLLSSLVIVEESNKPGKGYFKLAKKLGLLAEGESEDDFWVKQIGECFKKASVDEI